MDFGEVLGQKVIQQGKISPDSGDFAGFSKGGETREVIEACLFQAPDA
jgi:hypothetical protein